MSGRWNHAICEDCWRARRGSATPCAVGPEHAARERCCYCRRPTRSGIYVRGDPDATPCGGKHEEAQPHA